MKMEETVNIHNDYISSRADISSHNEFRGRKGMRNNVKIDPSFPSAIKAYTKEMDKAKMQRLASRNYGGCCEGN